MFRYCESARKTFFIGSRELAASRPWVAGKLSTLTVCEDPKRWPSGAAHRLCPARMETRLPGTCGDISKKAAPLWWTNLFLRCCVGPYHVHYKRRITGQRKRRGVGNGKCTKGL